MYKKFKTDIKKYWKYAIYSAKAQLKSEVANSYLNWLWWVLEPFSFMLIYNFIFGTVFAAREKYFSIFIFIGITLWDFFNKTLQQSVRIVKQNKPIVSKVYLPKYILLIVKMSVNGFKMFISFGIVVAMLIVFRVPMSYNVIFAVPILVVLALITFGVSCFLLHYGVFIEDLYNVVLIGLRLVFYMTGIFWNISTKLPAPYGDIICKANPVAFLLSSMRDSILYGRTPHLPLLFFWFLIGLFLSAVGIRKIYKNENSYVKVI